ncbi:MAG: glucose-6-phosphate dehydrogenase, partial [Variovorax sp.]|nr:glucose-6-phosphate dehydrogenase [Variovorax sp.]
MRTEAAPPATLVIFGITGDLAHRLLTPSLINMTAAGLLGDDFKVIGIGRSEGDDASLRKSLEDFRAKAKGEGARDASTDDAWASLRERVHYLRGDLGEPSFFKTLKKRLDDDGASNVIFYLATAPELFGDAVENLANAGLLEEGKKEGGGFRRVAIEKPFGRDHASAKALNERLLTLVDESQIYRIDHFLGKETVQNILVTRFANTMIEAVWNNRYIDHVQITAAETVDVGSRGAFYDDNGALRDMVPNHLFQLLAMVCMEPPNAFDAESIRNEKAKVFGAIRGPEADAVERDAVRGVYDGYKDAKDVEPDSRTETYVAMKVAVDSWRWAGVPFYLRTGKAMGCRDTHVVVQFKPVPFAQFRGTDVTRLPDNKLVIHVQPDEGVSIEFAAKRPGPKVDTAPVAMDFRYADAFDVSHATGYETLLYDMLTGDQTLFQRADGVEAAWQAVQVTLDGWAADGEPE